MEQNIFSKNVKAVIFDVDGTLYDQSKLRKKMLFALLSYYALRPWRLKELMILRAFRAEREKKSGYSEGKLEEAQYQWCAQKGNYKVEEIKRVVRHWMFEFPNKYLASCRYPGVKAFFEALRENNIKIGIYSDYQAVEKMKAMGLEVDLVVSSTDSEVDCLKPNPKGLFLVAERLGVEVDECVFIGDRPELDGTCALNAKMPYLIIDQKPLNQFDFYDKLKSQLIFSLQSHFYESDNYAAPKRSS